MGPIAAALLLALVVSSLQVVPARAETSDGAGNGGTVGTQVIPSKDPVGLGGGDSGGGTSGSPAADPDEFSVNSPHMNGPVVGTEPAPVRLNWTLVLWAWLESLAMVHLFRRH